MEICTVGSVRGERVGLAMVDLNGHEAGNGGHSQGRPTAHRPLFYSERCPVWRTNRDLATIRAITLATLDALKPEDIERTVYIRGEAFLAIEALNRNATHTAYDVGQIVYLARHFAAPDWKSLSIPKGKSAEFAKGDFKTKGIALHKPVTSSSIQDQGVRNKAFRSSSEGAV